MRLLISGKCFRYVDISSEIIMLSYCVTKSDSLPLSRKVVVNSLSQYYDKRTFLLRGKCVQIIKQETCH
jgi:hypothetical protein